MKVLDILKKFKDEIKIELDLYDEDSYVNAITKIELLISVMKSLDNHKNLFQLDRFFYITNIDSEPSDKPYLISSLDYDTLGVEIDYNLLAMLRVDVSDFNNVLNKQIEDNVKNKQISLTTGELYRILNDIIRNLGRKIRRIDMNHSEITDTYEELCDLYGADDEMLNKLNKHKAVEDVKSKIKEIESIISAKNTSVKVGVRLYVDYINSLYKKLISIFKKIGSISISIVKKIKKSIKVIKRKMSKLKILLMFKNMEFITYVEKKIDKTEREI